MRMEDFIGIVFWIVTLVDCLPAKPIPINDANIDIMRTWVKCPNDSTFYTPSNVEEKCIAKALDCFKTELNGTVKLECTHKEFYINQAVEVLGEWNPETNSAHSSECTCEMWPEKNFSEFLNEMESLLQRINTETLVRS